MLRPLPRMDRPEGKPLEQRGRSGEVRNGEDQQTAVADDPAKLRERSSIVLDVLEHLHEDGSVECILVERQRRRVREHHRQLRVSTANGSDVRLADVRARDTHRTCREQRGKRADPAADIEHAGAGSQSSNVRAASARSRNERSNAWTCRYPQRHDGSRAARSQVRHRADDNSSHAPWGRRLIRVEASPKDGKPYPWPPATRKGCIRQQPSDGLGSRSSSRA